MTTNHNIRQFNAYVQLGKGVDPAKIPFSMNIEDGNDETSLVWDDVEDAAMQAMDNEFSLDDFPNMEITRITIMMDNEEFLVVPESQNDCHSNETRLVLPEYTYQLTPEYKLYMKLKEDGFIDFEYDYDRVHKMMDIMNELGNQNPSK